MLLFQDNKKDTVRMTFVQYACMLLLHTVYAFAVCGLGIGVRVLVCSAVCFLAAAGVYRIVRRETVSVICLFLSVLLATWYIGNSLHSMRYAFVIFMATGLLVATFVNYKRNILYLICSDVVLIASAVLNWDSYGRDADVFLFGIILFCYNMANYTLCVLVYFLEKRMEMLEEKTREALSASESKGNFLANMSHEIRTPMNAIMGLNQLILQEDLSDAVREKAFGIQTACSDLLTIVNDILDFSKIESGKMEIIETEYKVKDLLKDVVNLIYLRTEEHKMEMLVDCDPNLPAQLYGDEVRIKQVIMNLLTNAVKFTQEGYVKLRITWEPKGDDGVLHIAVQDTGIGIRQDAIDRLFDSFEQLDTKRNRKVEGTGLGLAICKQLALLMKGTISVESEYGKGSTFFVTIPQKRVSREPVVQVKKGNYSVLIYTYSDVFKDTMVELFRNVKIPLVYTTQFADVEEHTSAQTITHYFVADSCYQERESFFVRLAGKREVIIMQDRSSNIRVQSGIKTLYRPFYILPLQAVLSGKQTYGVFSKEDVWDFEYTAQDAHILVVDDNDVNLRVTVGLMRPLNMHIVTANSGANALAALKREHFDLVFMDHMMPEMDGIETTRRIREMSVKKWDYYDTLPIIALTANAIGGAKQMFLENGFQDFLAKPMELRDLDRVLRKWLPKDRIHKKKIPIAQRQKTVKEKEKQEERLADSAEGQAYAPDDARKAPQTAWPQAVQGIDLEVAKHFFGGVAQLFLEVAGSFANSGARKQRELINAYASKDWRRYAIEAHALKSAAKSLGALVFAEEALEMELAGKGSDEQTIARKHKSFLRHLQQLLEALAPYVKEEEDEDAKPLMRLKALGEQVEQIRRRLPEQQETLGVPIPWEELEQRTQTLLKYRYSRERLRTLVEELTEQMRKRDWRACVDLCGQLEKELCAK